MGRGRWVGRRLALLITGLLLIVTTPFPSLLEWKHVSTSTHFSCVCALKIPDSEPHVTTQENYVSVKISEKPNVLNGGHRHPVPLEYENTLLLISIDGFRPEYLDRKFTPALERLANEGIMAESMTPQFPTLTFPNHYCIVTGRYPINNGIVHNRFYDPQLKKTFTYTDPNIEHEPQWWLSEPIWNTVQRYNLKSACMFWPGSEAQIGGLKPNYSFNYDGEVSSEARIDQVIEWLMMPRDKRPVFITLYFSMVDATGHRFGPDSPELNTALQQLNAAMSYLINRLQHHRLYNLINTVIVSDHGMVATDIHSNAILIDNLVDMHKVKWYETGPVCSIIPERLDDVVSFFVLLRQTPEYKKSLFEIYLREDIPKRFNYSNSNRIAPLLLIAKKGHYFSSLAEIDRRRNARINGQHGYPVSDDPLDKDVHAIFMAHGPKFPAHTASFTQPGNRLATFSNLELFHLFTYVLRIKPEFRDGSGKLTRNVIKKLLLNKK